MRHLFRLALPTMAFFSVASAVPASSQLPDPGTTLPVDSAVTIGTLQNGLRYYIRTNQRPENRAELRLIVNAGSVLEDDDQRGLAHVVEHMAFNGTENFAKQAIVDYLESIGMRFGPDINAFTSFDETVYMLTVPTDDATMLEMGFQILEEWAHRQTLEPEEIELERGVVIEEWRRGRGAEARMRDAQFPTLFADSKYAERLPIGTVEVLEGFDRERLQSFYDMWYRPDLMAVVAVGDFNGDSVQQLIHRYFAAIPVATDPRPRDNFEVPQHDETLFAIASDPEASNSRVSLYHKQPVRDQSTYRAYRQRLVEVLYNAMFNNRLSELAQSAEPPFIAGFSTQGQFVRTSEVYFLAALVAPGGIEIGLEALVTEAKRVAQFGFTEAELDRTKADVLRSMEQVYADRNTRDSRLLAAEYRRSFLTGEPIPGIETELELHRLFLPRITLDDVDRLAGEWLTEHSRVVLTNSPRTEEVELPTREGLLAVLQAVESTELEPYEDAASDAPLMAEVPVGTHVVQEIVNDRLGLTVWELGNGVRVLLRPTDFEDDQIMFRAFSPGGTSLVDDGDYIAASTASMIMSQSGVGDFNLINLQKKLAGKAVRVSPTISDFTEGMSGTASPQDVETMFQLMHLYFTVPRRDSTAFQSFRTRMRGYFETRSADPMTQFQDTATVTLTQDHYRTRPITPEYFDEWDLETSYDFYRDRFADASDFTFVFVGKFDVDSLRPLVETYLGSLPDIDREEQWRDIGIEAPAGVIQKQVRAGLEPKSHTQITFTGEAEDTRANRHALDSMTEVLQIMLRQRLREDLGGTYHANVGGGINRAPDHGYSVSIRFGSAPDRVEELVGVVFEQIALLQTAGPSDTNYLKVQEIQRRAYETNMRENGFWMAHLVSAERWGTDPEAILRYEELVDGGTRETIREAARTFLRSDNYVHISLFPEAVTP